MQIVRIFDNMRKQKHDCPLCILNRRSPDSTLRKRGSTCLDEEGSGGKSRAYAAIQQCGVSNSLQSPEFVICPWCLLFHAGIGIKLSDGR